MKAIFSALPIREEYREVEGEVRLWRAFLDQMMADAFGPLDDAQHYIQVESRDFLYDRSEKYSPSLDEVCELAAVKVAWVEYVIAQCEAEDEQRGLS